MLLTCRCPQMRYVARVLSRSSSDPESLAIPLTAPSFTVLHTADSISSLTFSSLLLHGRHALGMYARQVMLSCEMPSTFLYSFNFSVILGLGERELDSMSSFSSKKRPNGGWYSRTRSTPLRKHTTRIKGNSYHMYREETEEKLDG